MANLLVGVPFVQLRRKLAEGRVGPRIGEAAFQNEPILH
jgi:hypothetical protein